MTAQTVNIGLIKDGPNEFYDVRKVNANLDTIDEAIEEALDKANQAFQSASDGKQVVATAITGKGVPTSSSDTFIKMATNINAIETDPSIGTTDAVAGDILAPRKVISEGKLLTGTIPTRGATTITPTTSPQNIPANQYLSGVQTIAGVVVPLANVLAGITIAGAIGTMPNRGALNQTITTNNGQINISSGYYTGGVIKAIFANLVAGNIRKGVNIGGVVGDYAPLPTFSTFTIPLSSRFSSTPAGMTEIIPLPTPPASSFVVAVYVFVGYPPNGIFIRLGGGAPLSNVPVDGGIGSGWDGLISIIGNALSVYAKSKGTGFQYIQIGGDIDKATSFVVYGVI